MTTIDVFPDAAIEGAVRRLLILAAMAGAGVTPVDDGHQGLLDALADAAEEVRNLLGGYVAQEKTEESW